MYFPILFVCAQALICAIGLSAADATGPIHAESVRADVSEAFRGLYLRVMPPAVVQPLTASRPLAVSRQRCGFGTQCRPGDAWTLEFSQPLDADAFDPADIRIEPPIADRAIRVGSHWMVVSGATQAETTYTVRLPAGLRAIDGARLSEGFDVRFAVARPAVALWSTAAAIEAQRPPPSSGIPVLSTGLSALQVRIHAVGDADWPAFLALRRQVDRTGRHGALPGQPVSDALVEVTSPTPMGLTSTLVETPAGPHVVAVEEGAAEGGEGTGAVRPVLHWVQTTELGADAVSDGASVVVWVTGLRTGRPVADATVQLVGEDDAPFEEVITDAAGVARLTLPEVASTHVLRLVVTHGADRLMVPDRVRAWTSRSRWQRGGDGSRDRPPLTLPPGSSAFKQLRADEPWVVGSRGTWMTELSTSPIAWQLETAAASFRPPSNPTFRFATDAALSGHARSAATIAETSGVHRLTLQLEGVACERPTTVSVRADAGDVIASASVIVHPSERYVGVRPVTRLPQPDSPAAFDVVVVDSEGTARLDASWSVTLARRAGSRWIPLAVRACAGRSGLRPQRCDFGPQPAGRYRATARVVDAAGRAHAADSDLWIIRTATSTMAFAPDTSDTPRALWLRSDRTRYQPGDTARIAVYAPFEGGNALVTVVDGTLVTVEVVAFEGRWLSLDVPIPPNTGGHHVVYVAAVGPEETTVAGATIHHGFGALRLNASAAQSPPHEASWVRSRDRRTFP